VRVACVRIESFPLIAAVAVECYCFCAGTVAQFGTAPSREQITKLREEALRAIEWQATKHDRAYERIVRVRDTHKRERRA